MSAEMIDGKAVAKVTEDEVREAIARLGVAPGLVAVRVGNDPASEIYVRNKAKKAQELGLRGTELIFDAAMSEAALLAEVARLNADDDVDGILVQLPLPKQIDPRKVIDAIDPAKDVDGFHPTNVGLLHLGRPTLAPCTPSGVIRLLDAAGIAIEGAHAVVIGRSDIVGKPMALLLLHGNATVTVCHSRTVDLPRIAAEGDILVSAIGRPGFVTSSFVKPGATVVDVGTTQVSDRSVIDRLFPVGSKRREVFERKGSLVVGDVHPEVAEVAGALSPVPGVVGPLTIVMLLKNTVTAALAREGGAG